MDALLMQSGVLAIAVGELRGGKGNNEPSDGRTTTRARVLLTAMPIPRSKVYTVP